MKPAMQRLTLPLVPGWLKRVRWASLYSLWPPVSTGDLRTPLSQLWHHLYAWAHLFPQVIH